MPFFSSDGIFRLQDPTCNNHIPSFAHTVGGTIQVFYLRLPFPSPHLAHPQLASLYKVSAMALFLNISNPTTLAHYSHTPQYGHQLRPRIHSRLHSCPRHMLHRLLSSSLEPRLRKSTHPPMPPCNTCLDTIPHIALPFYRHSSM